MRVGVWRDAERKQPIVAQGSLITGETFNSVSELKRILANEHREEFYRTLTSKLMTYATGRGMEYYDVETIDRIVKRLEQTGRAILRVVDWASSNPRPSRRCAPRQPSRRQTDMSRTAIRANC